MGFVIAITPRNTTAAIAACRQQRTDRRQRLQTDRGHQAAAKSPIEKLILQ